MCSNFTATKAQFNNYLSTKTASFKMPFFGCGAHAISCRATIRKSSKGQAADCNWNNSRLYRIGYTRRWRDGAHRNTNTTKSCGLHWLLKLLWLQVPYQRPRLTEHSLRAPLVLNKLHPPIIRRHVTRIDERATRQITTILDYVGRRRYDITTTASTCWLISRLWTC